MPLVEVVAWMKVLPLRRERISLEVEIKPSLPYILVSTKLAVEDAWNPVWNQSGVEVALTFKPKLVEGVNGYEACDGVA